jgi:hypothetical protein
LSELSTSPRLMRLCSHLLAVSNFLNAGTSRRDAAGLHHEALPMVLRTISNVSGVSLMHYLASHVTKVSINGPTVQCLWRIY